MAVEITGRVQTREVRGTKLMRVREFSCLSLPSETYFEFRRDASQPCYAAPLPCAQQFSQRIEAVFAHPLVTDVVYSQDTTSGGRLVGIMTTYYATPDGRVEGSVEQRLENFGPGTTIPLVEAEIGEGEGQVTAGGGGSQESLPQ